MISKYSMTQRLVFGFTGFFILLTIFSGLILYGLMHAQLKTEREILLKDRLGIVTSFLSSSDHGLEDLKQRIEKEWPTRGGEKVFAEVLQANGEVISKSPEINAALGNAFQDQLLKNPKELISVEINDAGETRHYLIGVREVNQPSGFSGPAKVVIGISERQGNDFLASLRNTLILVSTVIFLLSLGAGYGIVRSELRPLQLIAAKIARIDFQSLHERIAVENLPSEVVVLVTAFNRTLDRLENAFARLSRFSSDIAHELRTPIANIMGPFEVTLSRPRTVAEYVNTIESGLEESLRIRKIIESLLFLARSEDVKRGIDKETVRIQDELVRILDFLEAGASEKAIELVLDSDGFCETAIWVEPTLFQRAIVNVLENAIRYIPAGGKILISVRSEGKFILISVKDNGPGIESEHIPHLFERFYRVDSSRNSGLGGAGLGLAIVKSIVSLHGGSAEVQSTPGMGTEVVLRWPMDQG